MQLQAGGGGGGGGGDYSSAYSTGMGSSGGGGPPSAMNWPLGAGYGNYGQQQGGYGGGYGGGGYGYGGADSKFGGGYGQQQTGNGGGYPKPPLPRAPKAPSGERKMDNRNNKVGEGEEIPQDQQCVLLVSNIPPNLSQPDGLFYAFEKFGSVVRIKVFLFPRTLGPTPPNLHPKRASPIPRPT